jgi:hypothetical protein
MSSGEAEKHILGKEIKSWKGFEYALRKPNVTLFNKNVERMWEMKNMLRRLKQRGHSILESLFIALIFQQRKMISELIKKIGSEQK